VFRERGGLCVDLTDLGFILDVEVDVAFAVDLRELGLAADGDCRRVDFARLCVEYGGVIAASVEGQDAVRGRLIDDGVGIGAGLDLAQNLKRLEVEDGDIVILAVAGEAAAEVVGDGDACTPFVPSILPTSLSVWYRMTSVWVPWET